MADVFAQHIALHDLFAGDLPELRPDTATTTDTTDIMFEDSPNMIGTSPADFAFEPPIDKTPFQYNHNYAYSNGSSFSSASGLSSGSSFSTTDALPAISRDFARPSVDTRRPATAGGALGVPPMYTQKKETIEEEMFTNPFGAEAKTVQQAEGVDPRHLPANRRASEGFSMPPPPVWPLQTYDPYRSTTRPQTSDGLPSFGGLPALPSARSVVGSVDGFTPISGLQPAAQIRSSFDDYRDRAFTSQPEQPNNAHKKRPRRRYDEIERMYLCGWNGCEKSYGTLNHLNAHVAMQKHGEKRLPSEFKELRKAFRKRKREQAAALANANASAQYQAWTRGSVSSDSDYSRRDSTGPRYSDPSVYYDSRPNTASSISSVGSHGRFDLASGPGPYGYDASMYGAVNGSNNVRRDSAPQHLPIPTQAMGFREAQDGPTPTQQNPFPTAPHMGNQRPAMGGFPFQALTTPMTTGQAQQGYGQFAFQR